MTYSFLENTQWLTELPNRVALLPFQQAGATYASLLYDLSGRSNDELHKAAVCLLATLEDGNCTPSETADAPATFLDGIEVFVHFHPPPPSSPLVNASVFEYVAVAGLIELHRSTAQFQHDIPISAAPSNEFIAAAEFLVNAVTLSCLTKELQSRAQMTAKCLALTKSTLELQNELKSLQLNFEKAVRAKVKRKIKKKKSASATLGHAKNAKAKAEAIKLYHAGNYKSVSQAAIYIAAKLETTIQPKTVANWLYAASSVRLTRDPSSASC